MTRNMHKLKPTRRNWLKTTAGTTAGLAAVGHAGKVLGANERINIGIIGTGGRGTGHLRSFAATNGTKVVAVCDVDESRREKAAARAGDGCRKYNDFRKLLDQKDIDAVVIATPDHWHCLNALAAMRAGKDVYVEKPLALTIREGRIIADEARRLGCIHMIGT